MKTQKEIALKLVKDHYHSKLFYKTSTIDHLNTIADLSVNYFQHNNFGWMSQIYIYLNRPGEKEIIDIIEAVALCHDILQNQFTASLEILKLSGADDKVIKLIEIITQKYSESFLDYILKVKKNPVTRLILICSITNSLNYLKGQNYDKYLLAKHILEN